MNLLEHEAKSLLSTYRVTVPRGSILSPLDTPPPAPIVLKSQVHTGGRGKAGGVRVVRAGEDATAVAEELFGLAIKGERPSVVLAEEVLNIAHEYYFSVVVNRADGCIDIIAHHEGGVEVETQHDFKRWSVQYSKWRPEAERIGQELADYYSLPTKTFALQDLVENLLHCFAKEDVTLLEINPLVITSEGGLVAGDCKMTLDDDALYRHKDRVVSESPANTNFVTLDTSGSVATIANGAGLAMATVDAVKSAGLSPANFLDVGGGATVASMVASFRQIAAFPQVSAIIINIFGGIVRCDEVARAIIAAREQVEGLPELYIRLTGTNSDIAETLLKEVGLTLYPTLDTCIEEVCHA